MVVKIKYVGPHDEVEIPSLGLVCKNGDSVDVDDEMALELIKQESWASAAARVPAIKAKGKED